LVIGGYAVGHHGYVRYTKDIDVWVSVEPVNLDRLRRVLQGFGFSADSLPVPLFQPPRTVLRFGVPPDRIEILSEISGVAFTDCYARRIMVQVAGMMVPVISAEDLVVNKKASNRPQDVADVHKISKGLILKRQKPST
jgi:hypothetical protein